MPDTPWFVYDTQQRPHVGSVVAEHVDQRHTVVRLVYISGMFSRYDCKHVCEDLGGVCEENAMDAKHMHGAVVGGGYGRQHKVAVKEIHVWVSLFLQIHLL